MALGAGWSAEVLRDRHTPPITSPYRMSSRDSPRKGQRSSEQHRVGRSSRRVGEWQWSPASRWRPGRLAALDDLRERVGGYLRAGKSENTRRAYRSDFEHFVAWCRTKFLEALPADGETVALYLADCAGVLAGVDPAAPSGRDQPGPSGRRLRQPGPVDSRGRGPEGDRPHAWQRHEAENRGGHEPRGRDGEDRSAPTFATPATGR